MTMIKEKKKNIRDELVRSGMGCCLFAARGAKEDEGEEMA